MQIILLTFVNNKIVTFRLHRLSNILYLLYRSQRKKMR
nr:MAG TPA: hypothetical protein [Bacteriophage sp.]